MGLIKNHTWEKKTPCAAQLFLNDFEHVQRIQNLGQDAI